MVYCIFAASGSIKKLFSIDFVNIYLFSILSLMAFVNTYLFSIFFSITFAIIYFFSTNFSIDFAHWKSVGVTPHCLYRSSLTLVFMNCFYMDLWTYNLNINVCYICYIFFASLKTWCKLKNIIKFQIVQ